MVVIQMTNLKIKTYSELITLPTLKERYEYLKLDGTVGEDTFGYERYLNQKFYQGIEWRRFRNEIIVRDLGCELGVEGYEIQGKIILHHLNPLTKFDLLNREETLMDPENLICVSMAMHNAIHYGDESLIPNDPIPRIPNDTCPWRRLKHG